MRPPWDKPSPYSHGSWPLRTLYILGYRSRQRRHITRLMQPNCETRSTDRADLHDSASIQALRAQPAPETRHRADRERQKPRLRIGTRSQTTTRTFATPVEPARRKRAPTWSSHRCCGMTVPAFLASIPTCLFGPRVRQRWSRDAHDTESRAWRVRIKL